MVSITYVLEIDMKNNKYSNKYHIGYYCTDDVMLFYIGVPVGSWVYRSQSIESHPSYMIDHHEFTPLHDSMMCQWWTQYA